MSPRRLPDARSRVRTLGVLRAPAGLGRYIPPARALPTHVAGSRQPVDGAAAVEGVLRARQRRRGDPPLRAPLTARRNSKVLTCEEHSKPRCQGCTRQRLPAETCCRQHHREDDGLPVTMEYGKTHRMGRCGACHTEAKSLANCCQKHHRQFQALPPPRGTELAPYSKPNGASAVT